MARTLDIYDPVRMELFDDIAHRLIDKDEPCDVEMRLDAMTAIVGLRNLVRMLAAPGTEAQVTVKKQLLPEQFKMIYWDEYAAGEYQKIKLRRKREAEAIAWIGA